MSDLISRDAVLKVLNNSRSIRTKHDGVSGIWINLMDAIGEIERVPAAEPVRHGHWINHGYVCGEYDWKCSVCGEDEWRGSTIGLYYCPNCGVKMDGRRAESHT